MPVVSYTYKPKKFSVLIFQILVEMQHVVTYCSYLFANVLVIYFLLYSKAVGLFCLFTTQLLQLS